MTATPADSSIANDPARPPGEARGGLGCALQPIVNIHSGALYGYTAVPLKLGRIGDANTDDPCARAGATRDAERRELDLHLLALDRFARLPDAGRHRLCLATATGLLAREDPGVLLDPARARGLDASALCLDLSETLSLKMVAARDQNPLTNLPGNVPIHAYLSRILSDPGRPPWHLVYLDFDYFKAFNDLYGFRRGDRAILLFADLLRKHLGNAGWFVGHVGGDDFFAASGTLATAEAAAQLHRLLQGFGQDVQSLYDPADRARGTIRARDRFGQERAMPLMRCSAAVLRLQPGDRCDSVEEIGRTIAELKHLAKESAAGMALQSGLCGRRLAIEDVLAP